MFHVASSCCGGVAREPLPDEEADEVLPNDLPETLALPDPPHATPTVTGPPLAGPSAATASGAALPPEPDAMALARWTSVYASVT